MSVNPGVPAALWLKNIIYNILYIIICYKLTFRFIGYVLAVRAFITRESSFGGYICSDYLCFNWDYAENSSIIYSFQPLYFVKIPRSRGRLLTNQSWRWIFSSGSTIRRIVHRHHVPCHRDGGGGVQSISMTYIHSQQGKYPFACEWISINGIFYPPQLYNTPAVHVHTYIRFNIAKKVLLECAFFQSGYGQYTISNYKPYWREIVLYIWNSLDHQFL